MATLLRKLKPPKGKKLIDRIYDSGHMKPVAVIGRATKSAERYHGAATRNIHIDDLIFLIDAAEKYYEINK